MWCVAATVAAMLASGCMDSLSTQSEWVTLVDESSHDCDRLGDDSIGGLRMNTDHSSLSFNYTLEFTAGRARVVAITSDSVILLDEYYTQDATAARSVEHNGDDSDWAYEVQCDTLASTDMQWTMRIQGLVTARDRLKA